MQAVKCDIGLEIAVQNIVQSKEFTVLMEAEIGVKKRRLPGAASAILPGQIHNQVSTRRQRQIGECPFGGLIQVVGQGEAPEIDGLRTGIVQLEPVREIAILITKLAIPARDDFVDDKTWVSRWHCGCPHAPGTAGQQSQENPRPQRPRGHFLGNSGGTRMLQSEPHVGSSRAFFAFWTAHKLDRTGRRLGACAQ